MTNKTLLTRAEAAEYLGVSVFGLAQMASRGCGPRYYKPSKKMVRYRVADLDAWIEEYLVDPS